MVQLFVCGARAMASLHSDAQCIISCVQSATTDENGRHAAFRACANGKSATTIAKRDSIEAAYLLDEQIYPCPVSAGSQRRRYGAPVEVLAALAFFIVQKLDAKTEDGTGNGTAGRGAIHRLPLSHNTTTGMPPWQPASNLGFCDRRVCSGSLQQPAGACFSWRPALLPTRAGRGSFPPGTYGITETKAPEDHAPRTCPHIDVVV